MFLTGDQMAKGYIMYCVAYPQSDCELVLDVEDELDD